MGQIAARINWCCPLAAVSCPALLGIDDRPIKTFRLVLEPLSPSHAAHLFEGLQASELYDFIPHEPPEAVVDLEFEATVYPDGTAAIAYIVFRSFRRQGFGSEGTRAVINHLFSDRGVTLIRASVDTRNTASIRLLEALSFKRMGTTLDADFFKGKTSNEHHYAIRKVANFCEL